MGEVDKGGLFLRGVESVEIVAVNHGKLGGGGVGAINLNHERECWKICDSSI